MAGSPVWKVFSADGLYVAACKHVEDAACLVAMRGDGTTIRYQHKFVVWTEGAEKQAAGESYDYVADIANARLNERYSDREEERRGRS